MVVSTTALDALAGRERPRRIDPVQKGRMVDIGSHWVEDGNTHVLAGDASGMELV